MGLRYQGYLGVSRLDKRVKKYRNKNHFFFAVQNVQRNTHAHNNVYTHKLQFYKDLKASTGDNIVGSLFPYIIWNHNWFILVSRKCKGFPLGINPKLSYIMFFKDYESGQNIITTHQGNNEKTIAQTQLTSTKMSAFLF